MDFKIEPNRSFSENRTLSETILEQDVALALAKVVAGPYKVEKTSFAHFYDFVKNHYQRLHGFENDGSAFLQEPMSAAKQKYYNHCVDLLQVTDEGNRIGVFAGNVIDWSSYYIRYGAILENYQGRGIYQDIIAALTEILRKKNVARLEVDVSAANAGQIYMFNKMGFRVVSSANSERWGQVLHFVKFLSQDAEKIYNQQFCAGVPARLSKAITN